MLISEEGNFHSNRLPHDAQVRRISWVVGSVGWPRICGFLVLQPEPADPHSKTPLRKRRRFRLCRSFSWAEWGEVVAVFRQRPASQLLGRYLGPGRTQRKSAGPEGRRSGIEV